MGRKRIRAPRQPTHGVARGRIQRAVLGSLMRGETLKVPVTAKKVGKRTPAGMTRGSWAGMLRRLSNAGYRVERGNDDYADGLYDTYRLVRVVEGRRKHDTADLDVRGVQENGCAREQPT